MQISKTARNIALSAILLLSSGCTVYKKFVPEEEKQYFLPQEQKIKTEKQKRAENPLLHWHAGEQFEIEDNLEQKITPLDLPRFFKRTTIYLKKRIDEKVYTDLGDNRIRDLAFIQNEIEYDYYIRMSYPKTNKTGDVFEREFTIGLYKELQREYAKAFKDALQDIDIYEYVRPFFEFNLKKDNIPFIGKPAITTTQEQKESPPDTRGGTDEFDQRIIEPYKIKEQEITKKWLLNKLTDLSVGLNFDFDSINAKSGMGIKPYVKWMDTLRWTYSSSDRTIEHKIGLSIHSVGIGFSAKTNELCTQLNYLSTSINYAITPDCMIGINGYRRFYDRANEEKKEWGGSIGFVAKF